MADSEFKSPAEIQKLFPRVVSLSTIYSACQEGLLPHYRVPSRRGTRGKYLIKLSDFLAWLEHHRVEGEADDGPLTFIR